jgi:cell division protein FtsQ
MEKVIDIEERIPSMREKRRRKTNKKFLFVLSVFIIALLAILYFQSPFSKVGAIIVKGAVLHEPEFYQQQSGLKVDEPLWNFSIGEIEESLARLDEVKSVDITRKWMHDVQITITEWKTVAYMEEKEQYNLLLENGEVFPAGLHYPEAKAPILTNFKDADMQKRLTNQLLKMDENVYRLLSEIIFMGTESGPDNITVYMDDGFEVRSVISDFAEKMAYYPEITAQLGGMEKGVIDMEVGTFFVPYSEIYGATGEEEPIEEESENESESE